MRRPLISATPVEVIRAFATLAFALIALAGPAFAQEFPDRGRSPVVDEADLLRPEQELDLTSKSEALYAQTGRQFVIATVTGLDGLTIEDYGVRLLREWKLGDEKRDDGVILLVAPNERKVRIETGYGAEGILPDILAGRIIRDTITPRFKAGDMGGGIVAGADQIIAQLSRPQDQAGEAIASAQKSEEARRTSSNGIPVLFWLMVIGFVALSMARRTPGRRYRRRDRHGDISPWVVLWGADELSRGSRRDSWGGNWGGGSSGSGGGGWGGGFGGFSGGGGSGGGGGASGSW